MSNNQPRRLSDFGTLSAAEQQVLDELDSGAVTVLGDGTLPDVNAGGDRRLRARFLRWLILGGDLRHQLHKRGLWIKGALIFGEGEGLMDHAALDLEGSEVENDLALMSCRFTVIPLLRSARMQGLFLNDSTLSGLEADRLTTRGGIFLIGATIEGETRLLSAEIGGNLDCTGATLRHDYGPALSADRIRTGGTVFLSRATIKGETRLLGAEIGGNLSCIGATLRQGSGPALSADGIGTGGTVFLCEAAIEGETRLLGAEIGGNLDCVGAALLNPKGRALSGDGASITGAFLLSAGQGDNPARIEGCLSLTAARIGHINDDAASWPKGAGSLILNLCEYGAFTGQAVTAKDRLRWLGLQDAATVGHEFWPQPYEQCAKVFREMGHLEDAKEILIAKERLQRRSKRAQMWFDGEWVRAAGRWIWDILLASMVRYGYQPFTAGWWLLALWIAGAVLYQANWDARAFKPNNAFVLRADEWVSCSRGAVPYAFRKGTAAETQLGCFLEQPQGEGFPAFNAWIYSADVLLPVVQLEQQVHWIPDEDLPRGLWGKAMVYFQIAMGWLLSALAIAGLSGLIKRE